MTDAWRTKNLIERLRRYSGRSGDDVVSIKLRPLRRNEDTGELEQAYISGDTYRLHDILRRHRDHDPGSDRRRSEIEIEDHETGPEIIGVISGVAQAVAGVLYIIDYFSKRSAERPDGSGHTIEAISVETRRISNGSVAEKQIAVVKPGEPVTPSSPVGKEIGKHLDIRT